jgi:hypothetical protein
MNSLQKILKRLLPKESFKKIENESKQWFIECGKCGFSGSYWDRGGIRAYAVGKKILFGRCPQCKKYNSFNVIKRS